MFVNYERFKEIARGISRDKFDRLSFDKQNKYLKENPYSIYNDSQTLGLRSRGNYRKSKRLVPKKGKVVYFNKFGKYPIRLANVKRGKKMTFRQANGGKVNPNFNNTKIKGYQINCQSCVVAFEARLRGYDVETLPNNDNIIFSTLANRPELAWVIPNENTTPCFIELKEKNNEFDIKKELEDKIRENQRFVFKFKYLGNDSNFHIISAFKDSQNNLVLYDPQISKKIRDDKICQFLYQNVNLSSILILRIDDKAFNINLVNHILKGK